MQQDAPSTAADLTYKGYRYPTKAHADWQRASDEVLSARSRTIACYQAGDYDGHAVAWREELAAGECAAAAKRIIYSS